jgi:predicted acylesterase/phospholipase RssA
MFKVEKSGKIPSRLKWKFILLLSLFCISSSFANSIDRPKIGLVLSGGGAKGFAHIGTLKMLDSLQIPIDCIVGTSMGGIAGALYAIGYNGHDQENLIHRSDWQEIFSDNPPRTELPYFVRKETGKYQLEFGINGLKPVTPSGLIFGQKVSLLFSSLTFPYEKINDFDKLPIPFRCVAVDLVTGNQVVLKSGSLAKAMRATMAIPTVFSPVEWGDSLLVDGGISNNLPIDVAKKMGADIIIAVDVESPLKKRDELNTALSILEQTIRMLGIEQRKKNEKLADIHIRPDLTGFTTGDFENKKIIKIVQRGIEAAHKNIDQFVTLKNKHHLHRMEDPTILDIANKHPRIFDLQITGHTALPFSFIYEQLNIKPADRLDLTILKQRITELKALGYFEKISYKIVPLSEDDIQLVVHVKEKQKPIIFNITVKGNKILPFSFIYHLLGINPGMRLDTKDLNRRIMKMYGLGYFEYVKYEIEPVGDNNVLLNLEVKELPNNRLRIGLRYDDFYKLVGVVNVLGVNWLIPGLRIEDEIQFAGFIKLKSKIYYPTRTLKVPVYPFANFGFKDVPTNIFDLVNGDVIASYKDRSTYFGFGTGVLLAKSINAEIEYQQEYMNVAPNIAFSDPIMFPTWKDNIRKMQASFTWDTIDDVLLPRKGFRIKGYYEKSSKWLGSDLDYSLLWASLNFHHTIFRRHTGRVFAFYGTSRNIPVYKFLNLGHPDFFVGLDYRQLSASQVSALRFDYRYEYKNDIFFKLMANIAFDLEYEFDLVPAFPHDLLGFAAGVKLLSPIGPIEVIFSRGDKAFLGPRQKQNLIYFILGYKF